MKSNKKKKLDRGYLTSLINEILSEDGACDQEIVKQSVHTPEVVVQNILNYITMAKCAQKGRETSFNFEEFSDYINELKKFDKGLKFEEYFYYRDYREENAYYEMEKQMRDKFKELYTLKSSRGQHHRDAKPGDFIRRELPHTRLDWVLNKDVAYYLKMAEKIIFQIRPNTPSEPSYSMDMMVEADDGEFQKLMDLANDKNAGSGIQALEMYEFFDLTERQIKALYNVVLYTALEHNVEDLPEVFEMRPEEFTEQEIAVHRDMAYKKLYTMLKSPANCF